MWRIGIRIINTPPLIFMYLHFVPKRRVGLKVAPYNPQVCTGLYPPVASLPTNGIQYPLDDSGSVSRMCGEIRYNMCAVHQLNS